MHDANRHKYRDSLHATDVEAVPVFMLIRQSLSAKFAYRLTASLLHTWRGAGTCIRAFAQVAWAACHVLVVGRTTGAAIAAHAVAAHGWLVVVWPMVGAVVAAVVCNGAVYVAHLAGGVA